MALCGLMVLFMVNVLVGASFKSMTSDEPLDLFYGKVFLAGELVKIRDLGLDGKGAVAGLAALSVEAGQALTQPSAEFDELFWGRLPTVFFGAALLVTLWGLARWLAGREAGLVAAWFAAWSPNLIAHSKWITFDIPATLGFVLGVFALVAYFVRPSLLRGALAAGAVGLAQLAKISDLSLFALLVLFSLANLGWRRRRGASWREVRALTVRHLAVLAASGLVMVAALNTVYGTWGRWHSVDDMRLPTRLEGIVPAGVASAFPLPLPSEYVYTVIAGIDHNRVGHPAYFHGEHRNHGWLLYFPAALALKTTLPLILLLILAIVVHTSGWVRMRGRDCGVIAAALLMLLYFMVGIHVDIGVRYVLSVSALAMAFAATSIAAAHGGRRRLVLWIVLLLAGWHAVESAATFPHHLSYFNELAGGSDGGWHWLNDSNLSWGQDDYYVRSWIDEQREPVTMNPSSPQAGLIVVDANHLTGLTQQDVPRCAWLRDNYTPVGYVTPAWPIFRIPDDARLQELAAETKEHP